VAEKNDAIERRRAQNLREDRGLLVHELRGVRRRGRVGRPVPEAAVSEDPSGRAFGQNGRQVPPQADRSEAFVEEDEWRGRIHGGTPPLDFELAASNGQSRRHALRGYVTRASALNFTKRALVACATQPRTQLSD
jgi:hypothetical protein